jgi:4-hydroxybenzoate polyprenyltransferase
MLTAVRHTLEMIRFSHTLFALPFALLGAVMAWRTPAPGGSQLRFEPWHLAGILICMVGARSAAMAFNRLVDRGFDAENPRTKMRHLPAGLLSVFQVLLFTAASGGLFLAGTICFFPNWLPLACSVPVLLFLLGYSYAKRFTAFAHFWLGVALMLAPVCVWIALRGEILLTQPADILPAIILGGAVLAWVAGFDMIYACQDADFDRGAKLRSIPAALGVLGALRLAAACHLVALCFFALLPLACPQVGLGWIYATGVSAVGGLLLYEHALVKPHDLTRVNVAFFNINVVISMGLFIVGTIDLLS